MFSDKKELLSVFEYQQTLLLLLRAVLKACMSEDSVMCDVLCNSAVWNIKLWDVS